MIFSVVSTEKWNGMNKFRSPSSKCNKSTNHAQTFPLELSIHLSQAKPCFTYCSTLLGVLCDQTSHRFTRSECCHKPGKESQHFPNLSQQPPHKDGITPLAHTQRDERPLPKGQIPEKSLFVAASCKRQE
ncbi:hypothetical protein BTVI_120591 [Pitangus sulphuratus]|nr:hypothetical protein BTVI_120591 [Pitangus sulphuratus]